MPQFRRTINDRAEPPFPLPPKAVALPRRTPKRSARNQQTGDVVPHCSTCHTHCAGRFFGPPETRRRARKATFPQPNRPPNPHAKIFSGRVCYFLRKLTLKPAEKYVAKCTWKTCAKRVENALIFCGLPLERLCKNLWITCGEEVESSRRSLRLPVD